METPPSVPTQFASDPETARQIIAEALAAGKTWLDRLDVNRLFNAYGILVVLAAARLGTDHETALDVITLIRGRAGPEIL